MIKRKYVFWSVVIGISIMHLTGCRSGSASNSMPPPVVSDIDSVEGSMAEMETDTVMLAEKSQGEVEEGPESQESENETDDTPKEVS